MKKVLLVIFILCAFFMSSVSIYAEEGLNATWYQKKGVSEDDWNTANFSEFLGSNTESTGNFEANKEELFNNLQEMGTVVMDTFELATNDEDWRALAEEVGCVMVGERGENDKPDYVVIKYTGFVVARETGEYQFLSSYVDNGFVLYIDNKIVFEYWGDAMWVDDSNNEGGEVVIEGTKFELEAGKVYPVEAYYYEGWGGEVLEFDVSAVGKTKILSNSGLSFFTTTPTDEEIDKVLNPPTPTPAPPTPTKAPSTSAPRTTASAGASETEQGEFPIIPVAIVAGVAVIAIIVAIIVASSKKKKK